MLHLLSRVFDRYAADRIDLALPGHALVDEAGRSIGHVDRIGHRGGRLVIEGWALAGRVLVAVGGGPAEPAARLPRADATAATGAPAGEDLGFRCDRPAGPGCAACLVLETGQGRYVYRLPQAGAGQIARARRRVLRPFLADLARVAPAALVWALSRSECARARIRRGLAPAGAAGAGAARSGGALLSGALFAAEPARRSPSGRAITIVLPVHNAFELLPESLGRVHRHTDLPWHLVVIEDASSDARVRPWLRGWVAAREAEGPGRITLIEHDENRGFIRSVNAGLEIALRRGGHAVLLNSDAFVPEGWASRLVAPIEADPRVASVTPATNDGEIFTVPVICRRGDLAPGTADAIDRTARGLARPACLAEAPTGVGFCMAINAAFLRRLPRLDEVFGRGYGEETDWCQRARRLGGRHLGHAGVFVEHRGGASFGPEKRERVRRNGAIVSRRHPGYDAEVQAFLGADPMAPARLALAVAWAAAEARGAVPVYLAHALGGGAEHYLAARLRRDLAATGAAVVLRVGGARRFSVELHAPSGRVCAGLDDPALLPGLLAPLQRRHIVYSCGVGDSDPLALPGLLAALKRGAQDRIEVLVHDYFPVSPSYCLLDAEGTYRGMPDPARRDPSHETRRADGRRVALAEWQAAWGALIGAADEVVTFSQDSRARVAAAYPGAAGRLVLRPHALHAAVAPVPPPPAGAPRVIGVLGNIGRQKGAALVEALSARLARAGEGSGPRLVLLGNLDPAFRLAPPARAHGDYRPEDIGELARRYAIGCWLIPSVWPETFSFTTREALATGLPVFTFDLGAQAEAAAAAPNGHVLPLGPAEGRAERLIGAIVAQVWGAEGQGGRRGLGIAAE